MTYRAILPLLVALALGGAKVAVGRRLEIPGTLTPYDLAYVPSATVLRWVSLGHTTLAANIYWLRAVQYMGDPKADARGWDKLFPILDLVTDLDPRHGYAYQVGGNILAGAGRIDESNRLLEKGTVNVPERYILPFHRGVNAFMYGGDYALAGQWFERAANAPGAPLHMREAVMALYVKGNQADAAIRFLSHMLESSDDAESRKALETQLQQAYLERAALQIDAAIASYRDRLQRLPRSVEDLTKAGVLAAIPSDPGGGSWTIGEDARAHSTVNPRRVMKPLTAAELGVSIDVLKSNLKGMQPR